jgi:hypothetical protein
VIDKGRYRQHRAQSRIPKLLKPHRLRLGSKAIIDRFLKLLLASDVPLRRLHPSVAKQELDLFEFASTSMAEAGATATKVVGGQIVYASPIGTPFDRIPDYVAVTSASCRTPFFKPRLNTFSSVMFGAPISGHQFSSWISVLRDGGSERARLRHPRRSRLKRRNMRNTKPGRRK